MPPTPPSAKLRGVPGEALDRQGRASRHREGRRHRQVEVVALPARAQATAVGIAGEVTGRVDDVYGDMLVRGRKVVGRIRRQKSTQDLKKEATTTVRRTKATATTAKKSASATGTTAKRATKRTTTAAKKNATATRTHRQGRHHGGPQDQHVGGQGHHGRRQQGRPVAPAKTVRRPVPLSGGRAVVLLG